MVQAYSRLDQILRGEKITVTELHRRIRGQGITVNLKSLYRLTNPHQPVERLDLRLAGAICQAVGTQLNELIQFNVPIGQLRTMSRAKQRRLEQLMDRNSRGNITDQELQELELMVKHAQEITLANSKMLAEHHQLMTTGKAT